MRKTALFILVLALLAMGGCAAHGNSSWLGNGAPAAQANGTSSVDLTETPDFTVGPSQGEVVQPFTVEREGDVLDVKLPEFKAQLTCKNDKNKDLGQCLNGKTPVWEVRIGVDYLDPATKTWKQLGNFKREVDYIAQSTKVENGYVIGRVTLSGGAENAVHIRVTAWARNKAGGQWLWVNQHSEFCEFDRDGTTKHTAAWVTMDLAAKKVLKVRPVPKTAWKK